MTSVLSNVLVCIKRRVFSMLWFLFLCYQFYSSYRYYEHEPKFRHLRNILGTGFCFARSSANIINLCITVMIMTLCKKTNQKVLHVVAKISRRLFVLCLERQKSCHIILALTLYFFSIVHAVAHFCNMWNFSANYDELHSELNLADYKHQNPFLLLGRHPCWTGLVMLALLSLVAVSSVAAVRRRHYNLFWATHRLYAPLLLLLLLHPLSGVLKEEIIYGNIGNPPKAEYSSKEAVFKSIPSWTCTWISLPLILFCGDGLWRICSRNNSQVIVIEMCQLPGRTISMTLTTPDCLFKCKPGQYVLVQCPEISNIEWHPFTIAKMSSRAMFSLIIRVNGDWTGALENLVKQRKLAYETTSTKPLRLCVDGPFSSPMEDLAAQKVCICVAAGVGITPFIPYIEDMIIHPRRSDPGRMHLVWIVRTVEELTWIADLLTKALKMLRAHNRPDRLHIELYVTNSVNRHMLNHEANDHECYQWVVFDKGYYNNLIRDNNTQSKTSNFSYVLKEILKLYPILGCRIKLGRPHWDRLYGFWTHLYPRSNINLYCCGPKTLSRTLRKQCEEVSIRKGININLIHESFS